MRRQTWIAVTIAALTGPGNVQAADGWSWLAGLQPGFQAEPTVSVMLGRISPGDAFSSSTVLGAELSLNCPTLQPPTNRIRQQFSFTRSSTGGTKIHNYEINPHYVVEVSPGFEIGGGPGLGYVTVDTPTGDGGVFGLQFGASAHYFANGPLFLGAEARYQITGKDRFGGAGSPRTDVDNFRFAIKAGYSF
jgi:opacity protein-like surface antigen